MNDDIREESIISTAKNYATTGVKYIIITLVCIVLIDWVADRIDIELQSPILIKRREGSFVTPLEVEGQEGEETVSGQEEVEEAEITPISSGGDYRMWAGEASWYGTADGECVGCKAYQDNDGKYYLMRNGERLDDYRKTVALGEQFLVDNKDAVKIGDWVVVTNTVNGLKEEVQVTDSGQFDTQEGRIADLSKALRDSLKCVNCLVTVETY